MGRNRRRIARATVIAGLGLGIVLILYLALLCHPGSFFGYTLARGGITLHSDEPIPPESAGLILDEVERRLARSPLAGGGRLGDIRVYVCNRRWRFVLLANFRHHVGGLTYPPLTDNIFLRPVRFEADRLIGPSGQDVPGERTLTYFIAHEIAHVLIARELGVVGYARLPDWKNEGYADLLAKGGEFDFDRAREQLRRGDRDLDPERSGLYLRYHLLVADLLEFRGLSVRDILRNDFDPARLEREISAIEGP